MAFLTFRGTSTTPTTPTSTTANGAPLTNAQIDGNFASLDASKLEKAGGTISGNLTITGNLTVSGTTTKVDSTVITLKDPVITLGGDTAPTVDDNKDRGVEFRWHDGSTAKIGFFGFDDSTGKFTFIPDAANASEVFSGTKGTLDANVEWSDVLNKPDPTVTVTLIGDVTGTANATLTDLGSGTISVSTTIAANSVALGTDTTGNYVASVSTTSPLSGGAAGSEGAALTLSLADGYGDTKNPYASKTANYFLAAPNGAAGAPTFRAIAEADIPTVSIGKGGTGITSYAAGDIIYASAANTLSKLAKGTDGQVLKLSGGVPTWGTDTTYSTATSATLGLVKLGSDTAQTVAANAVSDTASRTYAVQLNASSQMVVNVPWTDNNTTYSAGTGLTLTSTTFSVNYGTTSTTACVGNDSRLSDARTPTAHTHAASDITSGTIATARLGSGTANSTTYLRGDNTWAAIEAGTGGSTLSNDTTTNTTYYLGMAEATSGAWTTAYVSNTKLYFNPSTGTLNSTTFNSLSDARFKTDLNKIENALQKVKQLTGYTFTLKETNQRSAGLLAQDVELIQPESVGGDEERKTLNYDSMMGLIVEAIKELDEKLEIIKNIVENK